MVIELGGLDKYDLLRGHKYERAFGNYTMELIQLILVFKKTLKLTNASSFCHQLFCMQAYFRLRGRY